MKAISLMNWVDMEDGHEYREGDPFPHDGREIPAERLEKLTTEKNQIGSPVVFVEADEKPKKK